VLKPGGHLLAFSAARTYHHLATNIESVGFEIRDQLMWIYSSGFPKAQDIGKALDKRAGKMDPKFKGTDSFNLTFGETPGQRLCSVCKKDQTAVYKCKRDDCGQKYSAQTSQGQQWHGWKTALKPGHEPIVMARKPMKGSTIDNVLQHGVGALNIDMSRIPYEDQADLNTYINNIAGPLERSTATAGEGIGMHEGRTGFKVQRGRVKRPTGGADGLSRLEFGEREPAKYKDQKKDNLEGMRRYTGSDKNTFSRINPEDRDHKDGKRVIRAGRHPGARLGDLESQTTPADHNHEETPVYEANPQGRYPSNVLGDIPDYQKYFYCPKVSRKERHAGFEQVGILTHAEMLSRMGGYFIDEAGNRTDQQSKNIWCPTTGNVYAHGLSKIYEAWCKSQDIEIVPKRLTPMPGANGLKDIYDCYDKENQTDAHAQSKKFNPLTDSAPKGSRRCSTDSHERWHQGMEHKKGDKADPLAHIPTNPSGMYDVDGTGVMYNPNKKSAVGNNHPTVKPVALMRYLIQLVTPANSTVLDPFMGSGSTGMAAVELGHRFVGIDLDANYVSIADRRILGWCAKNPIETKIKTESPMVAVTKPHSTFDRLFE
jgi:hypothetical protein